MAVFHALLSPGAIVSAGDCEIQIDAIGDVEVPLSAEGRLGTMLGSSPVMRELFAQITRLARTPLDVLVGGETGTGKQLVSFALHSLSRRAEKPFVTLNCGTLAPTLAEAAIFGHRRGAFTGAESDSPGYVEDANGGTLFIDEIGELPLELQVKLLSVLDQREVVRLGETRPRAVDIRVIAATHRNLEKMVSEGQFREDLFFRLSGSRIEIPPLRQRGDDIVELAEHFMGEVGRERNIAFTLTDSARKLLRSQPWKGNVRELRHVMRLAAHLAGTAEIDACNIVLGSGASGQPLEWLFEMNYRQAHREFDRAFLTNALRLAKGSVAACARMLRMSRTTLRRRLDDLGIASLD